MLCYLAYLEKYVIQQLKTQLVDCLVACSCCRHLSLFMKRDFTEIQSVKKMPGWILKKTFYLYLFFIDLVCWLQLLCCWELDSVPVSQCVLVFWKKCFQLFEIFYFFLLFIEILLGVWNKEGSLWNVFLLQMVTFLGSKWNHLVETLMEKYHLWSLQNARAGDTNIVV